MILLALAAMLPHGSTMLLQVAEQHGPTWQSLAVTAGGFLQVAVLAWLKGAADDKKEMTTHLTVLDAQMSVLNTVVGTNGNGIIKRLEGIDLKLDRVLNEQAELRGATSHPTHTREHIK